MEAGEGGQLLQLSLGCRRTRTVVVAVEVGDSRGMEVYLGGRNQ